MKGIPLAFTSTFFSALVYIFGHEALISCSFPVFLILWNLVATICFAAYCSITRENLPWKIPKKNIPGVALYVALEITSAVFFFLSLVYLNPTVASFVSQSSLVFVLILGIIILKERFNKGEVLASSFIVAGIFLISFTLDTPTLKGVIFMTIGNVVWAFSNIVTKKLVSIENPIRIAAVRSGMFTLYGVIHLLLQNEPAAMPSPLTLLFIVLGGATGPFLSLILKYRAMVMMDISKLSLITAQYPVIVIFISFLFYGKLPSAREIIGGLLAVTGSIAFVLVRNRQKQASS